MIVIVGEVLKFQKKFPPLGHQEKPSQYGKRCLLNEKVKFGEVGKF